MKGSINHPVLSQHSHPFIYGILAILFLVTGLPLQAQFKTIQAGTGTSFAQIQDAIHFAQPGDTVLVTGGHYQQGSIIIDKPITLIGRNRPILDGAQQHELLFIRSHSVTVSGFQLQNTGRSEIKEMGAVMIYDSRNIRITDNYIQNANFGIVIQNSQQCTIEKNILKAQGKDEVQSGNGIHAWKSDSLVIIGNQISGHRDGLYFEFVGHSVIWRNISTHNIRYGIHFMFSNNNTYIANVFEKNESGVAVMYSKEIRMFNNAFLDNWGDAAYGILLKDISDSDISGNLFQKNTVALYMEGCSRNQLYKNRFLDNGYALKIKASCENNQLYTNNFMGNTFDVSTNGSLSLNQFKQNYWDKYEGYDLNRDRVGDIPYHPISLYSMIIENNPAALTLFRSFIVSLIDKTERLLPSITPESLQDEHPLMKPLAL